MNKLSLRTKQALEYSLGKQATKELVDTIHELKAEIDRLEQEKVDVTPVFTQWPRDDSPCCTTPGSGVWPPQNSVAITREDILYFGLQDHVGLDPLAPTDEVE